jgi:hypothetical protein
VLLQAQSRSAALLSSDLIHGLGSFPKSRQKPIFSIKSLRARNCAFSYFVCRKQFHETLICFVIQPTLQR